MTSLYAAAMLALLAPGQDTRLLAEAISAAVDEAAIGNDARWTAALLVVTAMRESRFGRELVGDNGKSAGPFHKWCDGDECERLKVDWFYAARRAREDLGTSLATCKTSPLLERLAFYVSGDCRRGQSLSRDRMNLAKWLMGRVGA